MLRDYSKIEATPSSNFVERNPRIGGPGARPPASIPVTTGCRCATAERGPDAPYRIAPLAHPSWSQALASTGHRCATTVIGALKGFRAGVVLGTLRGFRTSRDEVGPAKPDLPRREDPVRHDEIEEGARGGRAPLAWGRRARERRGSLARERRGSLSGSGMM